jgi:hypothetical protein
MLLKATLGLSIDCGKREIQFHKPRLPKSATWLRIDGLAVDNGRADLLLTRHGKRIAVEVLNNVQNLQVTVLEQDPI